MTRLFESFDRETTDRQYNPTLWTPRMGSEDLLPAHIAFTQQASERYREQSGTAVRVQDYGSDEYAGQMDVFRPEGLANNAPVVVYIHGGWWQWFCKEQFSFLAEPFNRQGYAVYMPGYRMAQDWDNATPMESIVLQMQQALVAILKEARRNQVQSVYLVGHSAGGHLVSVLHQTDFGVFGLSEEAQGLLKGVFSIAGLFDLRPLLDSFVNDAIKMSAESACNVSPQLNLAAAPERVCPLHLLLPEWDTPEFFRQTKEYQDKLLRLGAPCHIWMASDRDHLDVIEKLIDPDDEVFDYLLKHMG